MRGGECFTTWAFPRLAMMEIGETVQVLWSPLLLPPESIAKKDRVPQIPLLCSDGRTASRRRSVLASSWCG